MQRIPALGSTPGRSTSKTSDSVPLVFTILWSLPTSVSSKPVVETLLTCKHFAVDDSQGCGSRDLSLGLQTARDSVFQCFGPSVGFETLSLGLGLEHQSTVGLLILHCTVTRPMVIGLYC